MNAPNHASAIKVLDMDGWRACGLRGRPLELGDLEPLRSLGASDPEFAWERTQQPPEYFENLLRFRVAHYKTHGFGVHGLWLDGELVGQFGLQSLSVSEDQVEFAIFLGAQWRNRGLGSCLSRFLISRSVEAGMTTLWAVVRPDNPEGNRMVSGLAAEEMGTILHFGEIARLYRVRIGGL